MEQDRELPTTAEKTPAENAMDRLEDDYVKRLDRLDDLLREMDEPARGETR